jgi:Uma2 family endonuclease
MDTIFNTVIVMKNLDDHKKTKYRKKLESEEGWLIVKKNQTQRLPRTERLFTGQMT